MKIKVIISLFLFAAASLFIIGAERNDGYGPYNPTYLKFEIPKGWPKPPGNIFAQNKLTEQGFHE